MKPSTKAQLLPTLPDERLDAEAPGVDVQNAPPDDEQDYNAQIAEAMRYMKSGKCMPVHPTIVAAPEHSHPGESPSNGKAERSVRTFVELLATHKASLEARLGLAQPLPCSHPIVRWLVEHVAFILNRCQVDKGGRTPYGHVHGKDVKDHSREFGETVLWFVPKKSKAKLDHNHPRNSISD